MLHAHCVMEALASVAVREKGGIGDSGPSGFWNGWDQSNSGMGPPPDVAFPDDLQQPFATGNKCSRSWQAYTRA